MRPRSPRRLTASSWHLSPPRSQRSFRGPARLDAHTPAGQTAPQYRRYRARRGQRYLIRSVHSCTRLPVRASGAGSSPSSLRPMAWSLTPRDARYPVTHRRPNAKTTGTDWPPSDDRMCDPISGRVCDPSSHFPLAASTVNLLVEHLGAGLLHVRHDKAGVDALVGDLLLDHHAARARPRSGLVTGRVEAGDLAPSRS